MVVVELFFEDMAEVVGHCFGLSSASGLVEGLAYTINELRVLDSSERNLGEGFVQYRVGFCCEVFVAEVLGQQYDILPVLLEEFAAAFVDVHAFDILPSHVARHVAVGGLHVYAVAGGVGEAVGVPFELEPASEKMAVLIVGVVGEIDGAAKGDAFVQ